jgi:hypothetical protein
LAALVAAARRRLAEGLGRREPVERFRVISSLPPDPRRAHPAGVGPAREPYPQENSMYYAILCYDHEDVVGSWTKEEDDAVMAKLMAVQEKLTQQGKLGPVARLMPTTRAKTLRRAAPSHVTDGPFAETKEVLLGFFIVDCATFDEAIDAARDLACAHSSQGSYEIRPLALFLPGKDS